MGHSDLSRGGDGAHERSVLAGRGLVVFPARATPVNEGNPAPGGLARYLPFLVTVAVGAVVIVIAVVF